MKYFWRSIIGCILLSLATVAAYAQEVSVEDLDWQVGPTEARIGSKATIHVPAGYVFLGKEDTVKLMTMMENFSSGNEYVFGPSDLDWFAVFEFDPVGYVKDDDKLDAQALLDDVTKGTEESNAERTRRGWGTMSVLGWRFEPRYDKENKLLEWAFVARDDASSTQIVNYNTRLLGRSGVMDVVLVADPDTLDSAVADFKKEVKGFSFVPGERYAEYREGDKVAAFGLAALIAGGTAAVATKKGFWAAIVAFLLAAKKIVIAVIVGLGALIGSLFKRKK